MNNYARTTHFQRFTTMKTKSIPRFFLLSAFWFQLSSFAQGTAITYQGRLTDLASAANGNYDFAFQLFDAATGGASQAGPLITNGVPVTDGFLTVTLDFGAGPFSGGAPRWLQIGVRTNAGDAFDILATRQALTAAPYAITAGSVTGPVTSSSLSGNYSNAVSFGNTANSFNGAFAGNGAGMSNVNAIALGGVSVSNFWQTGGNRGANSSWYLGTADYQPLELRVNGGRGLRLQPASNSWPNLVAGPSNNVIFGDVTAASIAGGVNNSIRNTSGSATIGGGRDNLLQLNSAGSFIGGGQWNLMGDGSVRSVISGGYSNQIRGFTSPNAAGIARDITDGTSNTILLGETPPGNATIGGGYLNTIGVDCTGAVIGGGEQNAIADGAVRSVVGGGSVNSIGSISAGSVISGGQQNTIGGAADYAVIGGGRLHRNDSHNSTISGGGGNQVQSHADGSTIAGGRNHAIQGGAIDSTIGGGVGNQIQTNASISTVGGGESNTIQTSAFGSTIGGGELNTIGIGAFFSTIGGGAMNTVDGEYGTVPGGDQNSAADRAFAAGYRAKANHSGAFVWADSTEADFASTANKQFLIRASGGVGIGTTSPSRELEVQHAGDTEIGIKSTDANGHLWTLQSSAVNGSGDRDASFQIIDRTFGASRLLIATNGDIGIGISSPLNKLHVNGGITCVALTQMSDRHAKENFAPVSPREVLDKVTAMPITTWNFKDFGDGRHMGPMAQDFYAAFGLGGGDTTITSLDPDGVALAAIQGLNQKLEETRSQNAQLKERLERLEQLLADSRHQ